MANPQGNAAGKSQADRLAQMRARLGGLDLSTGSGGFWSPEEGRNTIRILPGTGNMGIDFFQIVGRHDFPPDGKKHVYCPAIITEKQLDCPICSAIAVLKNGDKASKKLADALYPRRSFWMNVIVRDSSGKSSGPFIYTPGIKVFQAITGLVGDPDYGDITDVQSGYDLVISRTGTGMETQYQVTPRRNPSPLSEDPDEIEQWLNEAKDLRYVEATEDPDEDAEVTKGHPVYILPYSRIEKEFGLGDEDDEEEDEPQPKRSAKPQQKRQAAPVEEPEEEEEPEIEIDEDDEEEEPEPEPVRKPSKPVRQQAVSPRTEAANRVARRTTR